MRYFMVFVLVALVSCEETTKTKRHTQEYYGTPSNTGYEYNNFNQHGDTATNHLSSNNYHHVGTIGTGGYNNYYQQHGNEGTHHGNGYNYNSGGSVNYNVGQKVHTHSHTQNTITKEIRVPVPQPYPVHVEKKVPYPVPQPYPVHIVKNVPVRVEVRVPYPVPKPYPVTVTQRVPVQVPVYVKVPHPVRVEVPVPKPYPVEVEKRVPVEVKVPVYVKVPVPVSSGGGHVDHIDIHHNHGNQNYHTGSIGTTTFTGGVSDKYGPPNFDSYGSPIHSHNFQEHFASDNTHFGNNNEFATSFQTSNVNGYVPSNQGGMHGQHTGYNTYANAWKW